MGISGCNYGNQNERFLQFHFIVSVTVSSCERESCACCSRSSCCGLIVLLLKIYNKGTGQDLFTSEVVQNACSVYRRFGPRSAILRVGLSPARPPDAWRTVDKPRGFLFFEEGLYMSVLMSN